MRIIFKDTFLQRLSRQIDYIASDSPKRARKFKNDVLNEIRRIPDKPYANRKSIYFDNDQIRDLIFKGYTIVYRINKEDQCIEIFGFTKYQDKPTDE
jgi:plasmid stabilization system protein ParE